MLTERFVAVSESKKAFVFSTFPDGGRESRV